MVSRKNAVNNRWEHFSHEADIGLRAYGETKEKAFEQAAMALTAVVTNPDIVEPRHTLTIHCQADEAEILFVDWLNAIIYEMAKNHILFGHYSVQITGNTLQATASGEGINIDKHHPAVEIKGATYTDLKVTQVSPKLWCVQTVVDV